jgi:hypothetical protein
LLPTSTFTFVMSAATAGAMRTFSSTLSTMPRAPMEFAKGVLAGSATGGGAGGS